MKRLLTIALAFTLVITMCFGGIGTAKAHAADYAALSVYDGDKLVKEYSLEELQAIAKAEGDIEYKYSGYNRNPSFYVYGDPDNKDTPPRGKEAQRCVGPTVAGILDDAGVKYTDEQLISFEAADGLVESFVAGDLFQERYYFPKGASGTRLSQKAPAEAYANAELTPPIIDLNDSENEESVLRFGQVAPNEQNVAVFVKYVADGGKIIVGDVQKTAWEDVTEANFSSGDILGGTKIEFQLPKTVAGKKAAVYYTMDGSEPGAGCDIYNFDKYGGVRDIYIPADQETVTIKLKVMGYGKLDSNTTILTYSVVDSNYFPNVLIDFTAVPVDDSKIAINWEAVEGATGYEISRCVPGTDNYELIASVENNEYIDEAVLTGVEYKYTVCAYKQLSSGQLMKNDASKVVSVTIPEPTPPVEPEQPAEPDEPADKPEPPTVAKAALESVAKTGYAGIHVKWNQVKGADGYEVVRTDAKGNKFVKTIKNGKTVSWKNTGLKTGRKYTYKVRAYVNFDGKKVYGKYSGVKSATPSLNRPVITKLTAGKNSVTVKWKQVPGANGYKIYRSTAKNGKYTCVKTVKKGGTLSWKNTKLKKGKKYYYKVKAYRIVDKKNVYSNMSLSKYTKSK